MITLLLAASIVVVFDPPARLPSCATPGIRVVLANGNVVHAVSASYLPSSLGIVIVPVQPGRIFCSGFEKQDPLTGLELPREFPADAVPSFTGIEP